MKNITILIFTLLLFKSISQTTYTVNTGSFYYNPTNLTIDVGDSVVWINDGGNHDVNGDISSITGLPYNNPETFDSPATNIPNAVIYSHKFTIPGRYAYDCSVGAHAASGMIGSIVVNPSAGAGIINIENENIYIYPSPSEDILNIHGFDLLNNIKSMSIFSLDGKRLIDVKSINKSFDISSLDKGVYFLIIQHGKQNIKSIKFSVR